MHARRQILGPVQVGESVETKWLRDFRSTGTIALSHGETCSSNAFRATTAIKVSGVGRGGSLLGLAFERNVVALQFAVERRAADAEHFSGQRFVAVCLFEDAQDRHTLHLGERRRGKGSGLLRRK